MVYFSCFVGTYNLLFLTWPGCTGKHDGVFAAETHTALLEAVGLHVVGCVWLTWYCPRQAHLGPHVHQCTIYSAAGRTRDVAACMPCTINLAAWGVVSGQFSPWFFAVARAVFVVNCA